MSMSWRILSASIIGNKFITSYTVIKLRANFSFCSVMSQEESQLMSDCKLIIPDLTDINHKGSCGRIGVVGGSTEFTGAPYFASISALKVGADLVYVFTPSCAAVVIKSYSPELMVMPYLDDTKAVELITPWLKRLHVILIGPGLGRAEGTFETVLRLLETAKTLKTEEGHVRPLVFDADGLYLVMKNLNILKDYPGEIYLTPNIVEFTNLASEILGVTKNESVEKNLQAISERFGPKLTIVVKGKIDIICNDSRFLKCGVEGSCRRCGGQGDLLSGILATFAGWSAERRRVQESHISCAHTDNMLAAYGACSLTRTANRLAFQSMSRSMLASDMILDLHNAFKLLFEK